MKKRKVFCINCRNFDDSYWEDRNCGIYKGKKRFTDWRDTYIGPVWDFYNTRLKNKNNKCKDYKRIWWKFWETK